MGIFYLLFFHSYFLRGLGNCFCSARSKPFHASGGVDEFRFARVEGVALVADFNVNFRHRGARRKDIPAGAGNFCLVVGRMDVGFHNDNHLIF